MEMFSISCLEERRLRHQSKPFWYFLKGLKMLLTYDKKFSFLGTYPKAVLKNVQQILLLDNGPSSIICTINRQIQKWSTGLFTLKLNFQSE